MTRGEKILAQVLAAVIMTTAIACDEDSEPSYVEPSSVTHRVADGLQLKTIGGGGYILNYNYDTKTRQLSDLSYNYIPYNVSRSPYSVNRADGNKKTTVNYSDITFNADKYITGYKHRELVKRNDTTTVEDIKTVQVSYKGHCIRKITCDQTTYTTRKSGRNTTKESRMTLKFKWDADTAHLAIIDRELLSEGMIYRGQYSIVYDIDQKNKHRQQLYRFYNMFDDYPLLAILAPAGYFGAGSCHFPIRVEYNDIYNQSRTVDFDYEFFENGLVKYEYGVPYYYEEMRFEDDTPEE